MKNKRPGFMLYFDIRPALNYLSNEERGQLLTAALDYAEFAVVPEFDGVLGMCWAMMQPKLDHDEQTYLKKCCDRRYATYCRECKKHGREPAVFEMWALEIDQDDQLVSNDSVRYPNTDTNTYTNTNITPTTMLFGNIKNYLSSFNYPDTDIEHQRQEKIAQLQQLSDKR